MHWTPAHLFRELRECSRRPLTFAVSLARPRALTSSSSSNTFSHSLPLCLLLPFHPPLCFLFLSQFSRTLTASATDAPYRKPPSALIPSVSRPPHRPPFASAAGTSLRTLVLCGITATFAYRMPRTANTNPKAKPPVGKNKNSAAASSKVTSTALLVSFLAMGAF